jgi:hypothetical protein
VGVHESHKKRFCQGCYRFTHLPLASTQVRPQYTCVVLNLLCPVAFCVVRVRLLTLH